jgi:hypothetical protein
MEYEDPPMRPERTCRSPPRAKHAPVLDAVKQTTLDGACGARGKGSRRRSRQGEWIIRRGINDPGTQLISASNNPEEGLKGLGGLPVPRLYVVLQTGLLPDSVQSSSVRRRAGLPMLMREV